MPEIEWSHLALSDLLSIINYISDNNPVAAQQVKDDIEARVATLPENPRRYRAGRVEGTREMLVWANYIIVYSANAITIEILRVLHSSQQWPVEQVDP